MRNGALLVLLAACDQPVAPEQPSWQVDVMPLMAANCVRCHRYPFAGDGATALRLDAFDDTVLPGGKVATGAAKSVQAIFRHTHDLGLLPGQRVMPPDRPLEDYELAVIRNWAALSNGETAVRGPGHPDNHPPTITLTEVSRTAASITFDVEVADEDRDLVIATIGVGGEVGRITPATVVATVVAGRSQIVWDTSTHTAGTYELIAQLDDGADVDVDGADDYVEVSLATITLP